MIDRTNQDAVPGCHAELTGLVPQLTTPSRHHGGLVDIWFGVRWTERQPEWAESFERHSNGRRPDPDNPSFFGLLAHASSSGLIVARHVSPERQVWQQVEEAARALIDLVNRDVTARRETTPSPPSTGRGWTLRVRDASAFLLSLGWLSEQKPTLPAVAELPIQVSHGSSGHLPTRSG
ncbi:MAG: hypothetical protein JWL95_2084 [Gemmatimonadetes bacterium]|nr:hypothetical protein [Gemmatimonadota bacterium]